MNSLKLSVGLNSLFLTLVGMILANLVMVVFWYSDVVFREVRAVEQYLKLLVQQTGSRTESDRGEYLASIDRTLAFRFTEYCIDSTSPPVLSKRDNCPDKLHDLAKQVMDSGKGSTMLDGIIPPSLSVQSYAGVAVFLEPKAGERAVVAVAVPRQYFVDRILAKQKTIFVYLLFNAIVLAVVVFFRLSTVLLKPVDQLIRLADVYDGDIDLIGVERNVTGEVGQLSTAIRSMLSRINKDKDALRNNISRLEQANRDLEESRQEMVRTEKMAVTGRLAAGLGHEIGNPLGIVGGYLELLKKDDIPDEDKQDYIRRAESELDRVHTLVRQLVGIGKQSVVESTEFEVWPLVQSVVDMIQHNKASGGMVIEVGCRDKGLRILAHPDSLKQVLLNCLLNSIDAVREMGEGYTGKISVSVGQCVRKENNYICILVEDNGAGLSPERQGAMFDPFFTTKEPGVGTGLGLTVSQSLVEGFGGWMEFESDDGQGAAMRILLPAVS